MPINSQANATLAAKIMKMMVAKFAIYRIFKVRPSVQFVLMATRWIARQKNVSNARTQPVFETVVNVKKRIVRDVWQSTTSNRLRSTRHVPNVRTPQSSAMNALMMVNVLNARRILPLLIPMATVESARLHGNIWKVNGQYTANARTLSTLQTTTHAKRVISLSPVANNALMQKKKVTLLLEKRSDGTSGFPARVPTTWVQTY